MIPDTGTPAGSLTRRSRAGLLAMGVVKRLLGCAALRPLAGVHGCPLQSRHAAGGSSVFPSHHTSPLGKSATLVKIVSCEIIASALGLVAALVPGTTPK